jgi:DNA (cytosine-5)-methyltransferase 1
LKVVSLFCGAGGLDLGFHRAGHKIIWANDFDKYAIDTYKRNFDTTNTEIVLSPIENISSKEIPEADVVLGGFPCQGFSVANPYRSPEDKRNELYLELLRVIKDKQPKFFIAENVVGLTNLGGYDSPEDKKQKTGRVFKMVLEDFREAGYRVKWKILNSADFGVPQVRKRVIIVGTRKDIEFEYKFPEAIFRQDSYRTLKDAIFDLPKEFSISVPNHSGSQHKVKINNYLGNRKLDWKKPSPTIVGRGGGTGGAVIHPHPDGERRLSVRECARIQSFPDEFIFEGSNGACYRQIGNAVPPDMAYHIAKELPRTI